MARLLTIESTHASGICHCDQCLALLIKLYHRPLLHETLTWTKNRGLNLKSAKQRHKPLHLWISLESACVEFLWRVLAASARWTTGRDSQGRLGRRLKALPQSSFVVAFLIKMKASLATFVLVSAAMAGFPRPVAAGLKQTWNKFGFQKSGALVRG